MGQLKKYHCNQCNDEIEVIDGGTMALDIQTRVCNDCKLVKNVIIKIRREDCILEKDIEETRNLVGVCQSCNGNNLIEWNFKTCPNCDGEIKQVFFEEKIDTDRNRINFLSSKIFD